MTLCIVPDYRPFSVDPICVRTVKEERMIAATDDDLDTLGGYIDLGFRFNLIKHGCMRTIPALAQNE